MNKMVTRACEGLDMPPKLVGRTKNFFALGVLFYMYDRPLDTTEGWLKKKFKGKDAIIEANTRALNAGYNYGDTTELFMTRFKIEKANLPSGTYRNMNGNLATSLGLLAASEKSGLNLFYGGYPITPASDILHTLAAWKHFGVQTFQAEDDKEDMDNVIRDNISDFITTRVITRSGVVTNIKNLKKVRAEEAKSIIIMNSVASWRPEEERKLADALVLKSIMSIIALCEGEEHPPIVCEIHSDRDRDLAENISNGTVKALNEVSVLSRMIAQLALSRNGLSVVYSDMVGFDGNEFYFYQPDEGWGGPLTFGESTYRFKSSTPMGIHNAEGKIILNPPIDTPVTDEDELIVFAEDDSTIFYFKEPVYDARTSEIPQIATSLRNQRIALLNWTPKTDIIMEKLCSYLPAGSELCTYVSEINGEMDAIKANLSEVNPGLNISINQMDFNDLNKLHDIDPQSFDSLLILSPGGATIEEMDAFVISLLIRIRQILRNSGSSQWPKLITEVMDSENIDIILNSGVEDFMVSNQFVSQIMAQVSEEPLALDVYDDLFQAEGSELYIKPATYYFPFDGKESITVSYGECVRAAQLRGEVILGAQLHSEQKEKDKMFGITLIPDKNEKFTLTPEDGLIALARDES